MADPFESRALNLMREKLVEDLQAVHPGGGQAKYLEVPTNRLAAKMGQMIAKLVKAGNASAVLTVTEGDGSTRAVQLISLLVGYLAFSDDWTAVSTGTISVAEPSARSRRSNSSAV